MWNLSIFAFVLAFLESGALAQSPGTASDANIALPPASAPLPTAEAAQTAKDVCAAFERDRDGYWTTLRTVAVNGVTMTKGTTFRAGVRFGGHDLGHELGMRCGH